MSLGDALRLADEMELDLVEISPNADPPVCKIIDYQKFLYQQKKKQKEIKANAGTQFEWHGLVRFPGAFFVAGERRQSLPIFANR